MNIMRNLFTDFIRLVAETSAYDSSVPSSYFSTKTYVATNVKSHKLPYQKRHCPSRGKKKHWSENSSTK